MAWFLCWLLALSTNQSRGLEPTDYLKTPGWSGNPWGPAAYRARAAGLIPALPMDAEMQARDCWGKALLRDGDIVFRLGDARTLNGWFPLSHFIAQATGSSFSHTGIVAVEDGSPVIYDCSYSGVQRQPFSVWMLDCVGSLGVKRLKPEHRKHIPGVLDFCRKAFEQQVPFDYEFRLDDAKLYCLELTEKAFRSQGLALSEPVRIGDWENLLRYPITAFAFLQFSGLTLENPITLEQSVYLPGNERQGVWASSLLETVHSSVPDPGAAPRKGNTSELSLKGDLSLTLFVLEEVRRSYSELPVRWFVDVILARRSAERADEDERQAGLGCGNQASPM
jgi:hypothetical protein